MEELDQRYLIAEVMRPAPGLEDRLYWEILRKIQQICDREDPETGEQPERIQGIYRELDP